MRCPRDKSSILLNCNLIDDFKNMPLILRIDKQGFFCSRVNSLCRWDFSNAKQHNAVEYVFWNAARWTYAVNLCSEIFSGLQCFSHHLIILDYSGGSVEQTWSTFVVEPPLTTGALISHRSPFNQFQMKITPIQPSILILDLYLPRSHSRPPQHAPLLVPTQRTDVLWTCLRHFSPHKK